MSTPPLSERICVRCHEPVARDAGICPRCGARQDTARVHPAQLTALALAAVLAIGVWAAKNYTPPATNVTDTTGASLAGRPNNTATDAPSPAVIEVDAPTLQALYAENEIRADAAYKGRLLRVSGRVTAIRKDFLDRPYLVLATHDVIGGVDAQLAPDAVDAAMRLNIDDRVRVLCRGKGFTLQSVMLDECHIERVATSGSRG